MNHRANGPFLPESDWGTRLKDAAWLGAGKLHPRNTVFVRKTGWKIRFTHHAAYVSGVTYSHFLILIMCRYSASSICELAQGSSSGEVRLNNSRVSAELTFLERDQQQKRIWMAGAQRQPTQGPIVVKGQVRSGCISCSYHTAQTDGTQLPENGNEHRLR